MSEDSAALEVRRLTAEWKQSLLAFFRALEKAKDVEYFQPHPFTDEAVERILCTTRKDLYYVLVDGEEVLAYGMLRGWDEGYEIPSLGIAVHPRFRSNGLGRFFMHFLRAAARFRGAQKVRLRVHSQNATAARLYESLGYEFRSDGDGRHLVGVLELRSDRQDISQAQRVKT
jgi:ribosomal protein S18 acetylase RimI-like enzyme